MIPTQSRLSTTHRTPEPNWPSIAIVTPSLNYERFLSACMSSVLNQNYPNLQYVVMDGGSSDGSIEIIKERVNELHYWTSQPDAGPYDAVAVGFKKTDAEIMGWIGADDVLLPWALHVVGGIFRDCPEVEWVTSEHPMTIAEDGLPTAIWRIPGFTKHGFRSGENSLGPNALPLACTIQQESTFWRRTVWERAGGLFAADCNVAGDFELWDRFFDHATLYSTDVPLSAFRQHSPKQRSRALRAKYIAECEAVLARHERTPPNMEAFVQRRAKLVGLRFKLRSEQSDGSYEPVHLVRRRLDTGRFFTHVL